MIILRILGGLGNQLFIYAFGRALQKNFNLDVRFDTYSGFQRDNYNRSYQLNHFNTIVKKANLYQTLFFPIHKRLPLTAKIIYPSSQYLHEDSNFKMDYFISGTNNFKHIFLEGYFQKPRYFENIQAELKEELTIPKTPTGKCFNYYDHINKANSVAMHIRRRELTNKMELSYFYRSMDDIAGKITEPVFFIFSDDIEWVQANFKSEKKIILIENNENQIEDFWLMTQCQHFIIPKSSYSWFASWLSTNKNKLIYKPAGFIEE